jgi:hypothetical protein
MIKKLWKLNTKGKFKIHRKRKSNDKDIRRHVHSDSGGRGQDKVQGQPRQKVSILFNKTPFQKISWA